MKALMLRKKIDLKKKEQEALRAHGEELEKREAELTRAIDEVETEEEQGTVEEAVGKFEREKAEHEEKAKELDTQVRELEKELADLEAEQITEPVKEPINERKDNIKMFKVNETFIEREDVQAFLAETRTAMREKRALTNVGLTIPVSLLGLLRENIINYSKLYKHVAVRRINGEGRLVIMSTIPEAVWTDCCANLNEMSLTFYGQEFDCWRVGGFYAICNASLEDSDLDLASELMTALAQGLGLALDKAILYGTGTRMPLGIVTRLAQTSEPGDYPATARPWADLHTSNIKAIPTATKGQDLFVAIANDMAAAKGAYSRGELVYAMNEKTYAAIIGNSVVNTSDGRIVGAVNGSMPVTGGIIEVLGFIPDNVVIGGYFDCYTLAERAGNKFATSEHVRFLQDQTVFRGTARYDGGPSIAEAFVAFGLNNTTPNATMTFASDDANASS
jgi:HK97 family phage major capsid protein